MVIADRDPRGAASDQCRQLAALACTAVDYPKTGHPAVLPRELRPVEYPDFMEKEDKPVYQSQSVLGQLYRAVKERATGGGLEVPGARVEALVLDGDLEVPGFKEHLDEAWIAKGFYDQEVTEIMHKYRIESEAQVVTGCIGSMSALHRVKPVKIKERIREAFGGVTKKAREIFEYGLGVVDREEPRPEERISDAERAAKAYAYYYVTYSSEWRERKIAEGEVEESDEVLLSFPWVAADVLGSLKARKGPR